MKNVRNTARLLLIVTLLISYVTANAQQAEFSYNIDNIFSTAGSNDLRLISTSPGFSSEFGYAKCGKIVIEPIYEYGYEFSEGLASVKINGKFGFINEKGELVIPNLYDHSRSFKNGFAIVRKGKSDEKCYYAIIDKKGTLLTPFIYDEITPFQNGIAKVIQNKKIGFVDTTGKLVVPLIYDQAGFGNEGLIGVEKDGKVGFINYKGETIIPFIYEQLTVTNTYEHLGVINDFFFGLARVRLNNKIGFIDKSGKIVIEPTFIWAEPFTANGLSIIKVDEYACGAINRKGKIVIKPIYHFLYNFHHDYAFYHNTVYETTGKGIYGLIDKNGKQYHSIVRVIMKLDDDSFLPVHLPIKIFRNKELSDNIEIIYESTPVEILEKAFIKPDANSNFVEDIEVVKVKFKNIVGWVLRDYIYDSRQ